MSPLRTRYLSWAFRFSTRAARAWAAFVILLVVALLGFVMLARWVPVYRARPVATPPQGAAEARGGEPRERGFPVAITGGHGLLGTATLVLVLLTALGIGGSGGGPSMLAGTVAATFRSRPSNPTTACTICASAKPKLQSGWESQRIPQG